MPLAAAFASLVAIGLVLGVPLVALIVAVQAQARSRRLERRLGELEGTLACLEGELRGGAPAEAPSLALPGPEEAEPAEDLAPAAVSLPPEPQPPEPGLQEPEPLEPEELPAGRALLDPPARPRLSPERLAVWVGASLGGFSVLLASLFALSVAIQRGWVSPSLRVSLALTLGMGTWMLGGRLRTRGLPVAASATAGAGYGMVLGGLYAASSLHALVSPGVAFGFMALTVGVALAQAARQGTRLLAWLGLVGGLLAPMLVASTEPAPAVLFSYLALLSTGALLSAARRGWVPLVAGNALGVAILHGIFTAGTGTPDHLAGGVLGALAITAPFAVAAWRSRGPVRGVSTAAAAALPLLAVPWIVPLNPIFFDPNTGREVVVALGPAPVWVAMAVLTLPVPALVVARGRGLAAGLAATTTSLLLLSVAILGWADHPAAPGPLLAGLAVAAPALPLLAGTQRALRHLPLLAGGLSLAVLAAAGSTGGPALAGATATLLSLGIAAALRTRAPWLLLSTLAAVALAASSTALALPDGGGVAWVAGTAVLAYGALSTLPLLPAVHGADRRAALTAALAGPAFFPALYLCWSASLGDPLVGALPALQGGTALLGAAVVARTLRADRDSGLLAAFVAVALLGLNAAIPLQLESQWLTLAWALEAAALAWLTHRLGHPLLRWSVLGLAAVVAGRLLANPAALAYGSADGWPILNWTLYTWGVPAVALLAAAHWLRPSTGSRAPATPLWERQAPAGLLITALVLIFALINVEVSHLFQAGGPLALTGADVGQAMARSLSWAVYGIALLAVGLGRGSRLVRLLGFAVVMLAAGKVFAVDLWSLSGLVRVGSVAGLGVSLLLAAFLFERLVLRGGTARPEES